MVVASARPASVAQEGLYPSLVHGVVLAIEVVGPTHAQVRGPMEVAPTLSRAVVARTDAVDIALHAEDSALRSTVAAGGARLAALATTVALPLEE